MPRQSPVSRRRFFATAIGTAALGRIGSAASQAPAAAAPTIRPASASPALLGGTPLRRRPFPPWPVASAREEDALVDVVRSGEWYRGEQVAALRVRLRRL